jgi:hypothetical protein
MASSGISPAPTAGITERDTTPFELTMVDNPTFHDDDAEKSSGNSGWLSETPLSPEVPDSDEPPESSSEFEEFDSDGVNVAFPPAFSSTVILSR